MQPFSQNAWRPLTKGILALALKGPQVPGSSKFPAAEAGPLLQGTCSAIHPWVKRHSQILQGSQGLKQIWLPFGATIWELSNIEGFVCRANANSKT